MKIFFFIYLITINLFAYSQFWLDKGLAKKGVSYSGKARIREKTLFLTAIFGGALGALIGMCRYRHKTKHWQFVVFIPLILLMQIVAVCYFCMLTNICSL